MPDRAVRVAVTGAAGRLGSRAVALLVRRGHSVVAIDRRVPTDSAGDERTNWRAADLTDYGSVLAALEGCDALVHLAAFAGPGHAPAWAVHHNNVMASYNALHAAAGLGIGRICQASSVNAIGGAYSRAPRFDYFPVDEVHPSYTEDAYSLSKWICEQQAASIARRYDGLPIASLRFHLCVEDRGRAVEARRERPGTGVKDLWGYVSTASAAGACLLAIGAVGAGRHGPGYAGHEAFLIVAPDHVGPGATGDLAAEHYPGVPVRGALGPTDGFFNCAKAERLLGWRHEEW
ncbi:MAG: NAD-dependent epimerase/dehydratase family protein [Acidimicrobiales bacterium]